MTEDVGVAGAGQYVIDASVAQVHLCVAADVTLQAAAVDVFRLGQSCTVSRAAYGAVQVDGGAVAGVVGVGFGD